MESTDPTKPKTHDSLKDSTLKKLRKLIKWIFRIPFVLPVHGPLSNEWPIEVSIGIRFHEKLDIVQYIE